MNTLANEARIILEAAALALEIKHPDIVTIRAMLKQADAHRTAHNTPKAGWTMRSKTTLYVVSGAKRMATQKMLPRPIPQNAASFGGTPAASAMRKPQTNPKANQRFALAFAGSNSR